ncbi:secretory lipase [Herbihabitans rhizosphaerae]|uniref:Secretory lipase n=1 Tax=Herbihabitans rhizosphaerae TaxID=1872711 RepID=A0A4V2EU24_9PSEU|nr:lipase family protein [Herbihabitans rhizosphaerae]RZS43083.1 secretory lipase [Herbihabitans rhizosphaerae]
MIRAAVTVTAAIAALVAAPTAPAAVGAPGEVIGVAPLPGQHWLPGTGKAYRLTYRTTGPSGPASSTGALFVPRGTPPPGGWPVISWAHGTFGISDACGPSTTGTNERDTVHLAALLEQGYAVAATDYIGLGAGGVHPYLDGRSEAHAVIDIVRAASTVDSAVSRTWVVAGHSQGGHAALFTTKIAPTYARELDFRGGVATAAPSNITAVLALAAPGEPVPFATTLLTYILASFETTRPDVDMEPYLSDRGLRAISDARRLCYRDLEKTLVGVTVGQLLRKPLALGDFLPAARQAMEPPSHGYERPFFVGLGTFDWLTPLTGKLLAEFALHGEPVTARFYPSDHDNTMDLSRADTIPYVRWLIGRRSTTGPG